MIGGGTFGVSRAIRGGAHASRPSQYYMGFWPCQQADGDADDEQVTDYSGKGAHASINALTTSEIWANAGAATTIASPNHYPEVPVAFITHRFATASRLVHLRIKGVKGASVQNFYGNGYDSTHTGIRAWITTSGAVTWGFHHGASSNSANWTGTTDTPFATESWNSLGFFYDCTTAYGHIYINGVLALISTNITKESVARADDHVVADLAIGGWAGNANLFAGQVNFSLDLDLPGMAAPSNLSALMYRLHAHPRLPLREEDFV